MVKKKSTVTSTNTAAPRKKKSGAWGKSTCKAKDIKELRSAGLISKSNDDVKLPSEELKWFYVRDQPIGDQEYRLAPFSTDEVQTKRTWKHDMIEAEVVEVDKLMAQVQELQEKVYGVQIITTFIKHRVQPLQARAHTLWLYSGPLDPTRVSKEDFSVRELEKSVKNVTRLKTEDELPGEPSVAPYGIGNPLPKRNSEGLEGDASSSSSAQSQLKKKPEAEPKEASGTGPKDLLGLKLKGALSVVPLQTAPPAPSSKKLHASEAPLVPPGWNASLLDINSDMESDDQLLSVRRDVVLKRNQGPTEKTTDSTAAKGAEVIGTSQVERHEEVTRASPKEAKQASNDLSFEHLLAKASEQYAKVVSEQDHVLKCFSQATAEKYDALCQVNELKRKLESHEKESQEALDRAKTEGEEREKKRCADTAAREDGLATRLRALAAKLLNAIEAPLDHASLARVDSLTDVMTEVEGYGDQARELLARLKGALGIFHANMHPKVDVPQALEKLVDLFCAEENPLADFSRVQIETWAKITMAVLMAHGIQGDFEKATTTYPKDADGEDMSLKPYAKMAKKCVKQLSVVLSAHEAAQGKAAAKAAISETKVTDPTSTSAPRGSPLPKQSTSAAPHNAPDGQSSKGDDSTVLSCMRECLKTLEQELKSVKECLDVCKLKANRAIEGEKFLLEEIKELNEQLRCIQDNPQDEGKRVRDRLDSLYDAASHTAHSFWSDRNNGYALEGIAALMRKFFSVRAIKDCIRQQLIGGARVALGFVRVHHPQINLEVIGSGLPPSPDDRVQMEEHYVDALGPTENIVRLVEAEECRILQQ
ncbi:hypothetical protein ACQ4PT_057038 [Festuca glaucescens]